MKIIVHQHQTSIYTGKENQYLLEKTIKKIRELEHYQVIFDQNRFIIKFPFTQYHKSKIIKAFAIDKEQKLTNKIITGYKGCLITGHKLEWL